MKATISTFVVFGKFVSLDVKVKLTGLSAGQRNFFAVSQNINYTSNDAGEAGIPTGDFVESASRLINDLREMADKEYGSAVAPLSDHLDRIRSNIVMQWACDVPESFQKIMNEVISLNGLVVECY